MVQTKRIADDEHGLPHLEVGGPPQGDGRKLLLGGVDLEHCQIFVGRCAHDCRSIRLFVGEANEGGGRVLDDVEIGHNVTFIVPHKTRSGPLGYLRNAQSVGVALNGHAGNVHHTRGGLFKEADCGLLITRNGHIAVANGVENAPQNHRRDDEHPYDETDTVQLDAR